MSLRTVRSIDAKVPPQNEELRDQLPIHLPSRPAGDIRDKLLHQQWVSACSQNVKKNLSSRKGISVFCIHTMNSKPPGIFVVFYSPFYNLCTKKAWRPVPHALSMKVSPPLLQATWCLCSGSTGAHSWPHVCLWPITAFRHAGGFLMTTWQHCFGQHNSCKSSWGNQTLFSMQHF